VKPDVIDLSHHNASVAFGEVRAAGVAGVILKATEATTYIDPTFKQRRIDAMKAGLKVASYHFLKRGNVAQQMLHYLDVVSPAKGERVIIDYEDPPCTLDDLRAAVKFLWAQADLNLQVTVYGGSKLEQDLDGKRDELLAKTSLWTAQYATTKPNWSTATWPVWTLWQYTDKAVVPGVAGRCDANTFNGSAEALLRWMSPPLVEAPPPPPPPKPEPVGDVVIAVTLPPGVTVDFFVNGEQYRG
jgi:lysozyme